MSVYWAKRFIPTSILVMMVSFFTACGSGGGGDTSGSAGDGNGGSEDDMLIDVKLANDGGLWVVGWTKLFGTKGLTFGFSALTPKEMLYGQKHMVDKV